MMHIDSISCWEINNGTCLCGFMGYNAIHALYISITNVDRADVPL